MKSILKTFFLFNLFLSQFGFGNYIFAYSYNKQNIFVHRYIWFHEFLILTNFFNIRTEFLFFVFFCLFVCLFSLLPKQSLGKKAKFWFRIENSKFVKSVVITGLAYRITNFQNSEFQFSQFKVLQSVFLLFNIKSYIGIFWLNCDIIWNFYLVQLLKK